MSLLGLIWDACRRAAGGVACVPEKVQTLLEQIERSEFGGIDYSETSISTCWIRLPGDRSISARWHSNGQRSELQMRKGKSDHVELPHDQWSEMILRTIILKCRTHYNDQLKELLDV